MPTQCIYCFRMTLRKMSTIVLKTNNQLIFVTETRCDFFEVRTECSNIIYNSFVCYRVKRCCYHSQATDLL